MTSSLTVAEAGTHFPRRPGYLSACTMGVPTHETSAALHRDLDAWCSGSASAATYGQAVEDSRALYATLVGVAPEAVATGSQTSSLVSIIAAGMPDNAEILCVTGDFSSVVHPFVQQAHRGVTVRFAELHDLADAVTDATTLVAFSLVQSATGAVANSDAVREAAARHAALTLCDLTQAAGWLPVNAGDFDATVCHTYKWLCSPRGAAFLTLSPALIESLVPIAAGWYSADDVWSSCYATHMPLAKTAGRFDVSPAWSAWVGAREALTFFNRLDLAAVREHCAGLGDELCRGLGIAEAHSAIVTWPDADATRLAALTAAGLTASGRAGRVRVAFHLWNTREDVAAILAAVHGEAAGDAARSGTLR
ncbi:aminotransferase class V-fold PLP-dependent enzyme [Klugiella xanthotipulae]|uniref:Selenocysteine lyase/cysteine desulfurase n=1 Tax=Klugiella xanthotipulae TaxID=244735 RepID=A0A543I427_9MICO|nr:selenocysteine lyase/cysteine desulfurase [Klugiella xanthotipulae]